MSIWAYFPTTLVVLLAVSTLSAGETGEEATLGTQAQYQRKSITYLGIGLDQGVSIPEDTLQVIEKTIRQKLELDRFDYNHVDLGQVYTLDQFVDGLRGYLAQRVVDRAAAEAEYQARFKRAQVLVSDIDRVMGSAYFYTLRVHRYQNRRAICPTGKLDAMLLGCVPGISGMRATLDASATFYSANLTEVSQPAYQLIKTVKHKPVKCFKSIKLIEVKPEELSEVERKVGLEAVKGAADDLAAFLSKGMKQIPDFRLLTPIAGALSDGVEFMLGKDDGVRMDETYEVIEFDAAGERSLIGYVRVRRVGDAKGTGEGRPSYAEKVKEKRSFVGGEMLTEHPMAGMAVGVHGILELTIGNLLDPDQDGLKMNPGIGLYVDKSLANLLKIPELYLSLEMDFILVGKFGHGEFEGEMMSLVHGMVGVKKKWYAESLVLSLGARAGISYFIISGYEDDALGVGGDLWAGLEYYFIPEFSLYLKGAGRFFTNPLTLYAINPKPEIGINLEAGAFLGF